MPDLPVSEGIELGPLATLLRIRVLDAGAARVVGTMPVAGNTQPAGLLHGGASVVLAETLGSVGAALHARDVGRQAVGVEVNATHHRPARTGVVTAVATAVHLGRTLASYEIVLRDEQDRRICTARLTCALVGD